MTTYPSLPLINPKSKENEILDEELKLSNVQVVINLAMKCVDHAKAKMREFDSWVDYGTVVHIKVIRKENKVKAVEHLCRKCCDGQRQMSSLKISNGEISLNYN